MRSTFALATTLLLASLGLGVASSGSEAGLLPTVSLSNAHPGLVENVRHRRYLRHLRRDKSAPAAPTGERTAAIGAGPGTCGEFKKWDGTRCVDVRYMEPHFK
jgi:hypothetical protein